VHRRAPDGDAVVDKREEQAAVDEQLVVSDVRAMTSPAVCFPTFSSPYTSICQNFYLFDFGFSACEPFCE
jgi:hypothetical protein